MLKQALIYVIGEIIGCGRVISGLSDISANAKFFPLINEQNLIKTLQNRLESETAIIATRTISSITRALIRICPSEKPDQLKYNGSLLTAAIVEENEEGAEVYSNLTPGEIVQTVIEIFFGQATFGNKDKKTAKKAADQIKDIVVKYKTSVRK